ncbi:MAG: alpha/beta fold hydrolase [Betaproteobacteria bacterium]|nr:alpha/beta fold hydrolase [Betaproteobacteria bacterium]
MTRLARFIVRLLLAALITAAPPPALAQEPIGIVIMHGKGGSPTRFVSDLARTLEGKGYLVANLEMPWSGRLNYSLPAGKAEEDVTAAVAGLRGKGAKKVFIAGHSLGGAYTLHLAGSQAVDGFIAIAPGGNINSPVNQERLGGSIALARKLVAEGKGNEPARLEDFEPGRGAYPIDTVPAAYLTWHDAQGPMNMDHAAKAANPRLPILFIIPTRDYPGLLKSSPGVFRSLPPNALTKLHQPDSDHLNAPGASADEIARWTREVASASRR